MLELIIFSTVMIADYEGQGLTTLGGEGERIEAKKDCRVPLMPVFQSRASGLVHKGYRALCKALALKSP